jgi:hypothetical protein
MGTELPSKVLLGQTLVLMQMTFLNNIRKVGRLVLSRTSCFLLRVLWRKHGWTDERFGGYFGYLDYNGYINRQYCDTFITAVLLTQHTKEEKRSLIQLLWLERVKSSAIYGRVTLVWCSRARNLFHSMEWVKSVWYMHLPLCYKDLHNLRTTKIMLNMSCGNMEALLCSCSSFAD